jgi:hypothetical protein
LEGGEINMVNSSQKKQNGNKNDFNPVAAAVAGAIIGAGVGAVGAIALSNEKNRNNVKKAFSNAKDQAVGYIEDVQKQVENKKDQAKEKIAESSEKAKK